MSTWNDFFNDAAVQRQQLADINERHRMSRRHTADMEEMAAKYDRIAAGNASNLAMREALARQLAKFDPTNPLIVDQKFRDKLMDTAEAAYFASFSAGAGRTKEIWDIARAIGRNYPIPGR